MNSPVQAEQDAGVLTLSAKWSTWVLLVVLLLTGSGAGYVVKGADAYTGDQARQDWQKQHEINSTLFQRQNKLEAVLAEIRTDIKWLIRKEQRQGK